MAPHVAGSMGSSVGAVPSSFVENRGQERPLVAFTYRGENASLYFTSGGLTTALENRTQRWAVETTFVGARDVRPVGTRRENARVSYFRGSPSEWVTGARTFSEVVYPDLWPGIDLVYSTGEGALKYEFRVAPGADPSAIRLAYRGASSVGLRPDGGVQVTTPAGAFIDRPPVSYQPVGGKRVPVASRYLVEGNIVRFALDDFDSAKPLVIDPVVILQSGYLGGSSLDEAYGVDIDGTGSAYVTGLTHSTEATFPVKAGPDLSHNDDDGEGDAFVAKLGASGTLDYVGYIGGSAYDVGSDVAVDASGAAYVTGYTESSQGTFPVLGGPDRTFNGGSDAFITKVSPSGTSLAFSGYVGGSDFEGGNGVAVDGTGSAYIVGDTESTEATFPVRTGPDLTYNGLGDAFLAKVTASGSGLTYAGYVGGADWDIGNAIAVDASGNAYLAGMATSTESTFPEAVGPDLTHNGDGDAYVAKVFPTGNGLEFAGYVGGSAWDAAWGIAVDSAGNAHLTGDTGSPEGTFPVKTGPDLTYNGSFDAFVARLNAGGISLSYAGYIGGSGNDYAGFSSLDVDDMGNAYVTGVTNSPGSSFPATIGPDLTHNGANDAYVAKLTPSGTLGYAGFIGGAQHDAGYGVAVDGSRIAHVVGGTNSTEATFPVASGPDQTYNDIGIGDAFITKVGTIHALTVTKSGSGSGTITSSPPGISCGTDCDEQYLEGTSVILTATASTDARFDGWSGACSGTATCQVSVDAAKTATATFTELIPPETTITTGPPSPSRFPTAQFTFSSNEAGSTFACSLDGGAFETCTSPSSYADLTEGPHEFRVRATDASGNTDPSAAVWSWTVDLTPPDTSVTSGPSGITTSPEATFSFASTDPTPIFSCSLDNDGFAPCTSPMSYSSLTDGTHTFSVRAEDPAGNVDETPATQTWVVDAQGPVITFVRPGNGLYVNDQQVGGQGPTVVIGHVTVRAQAVDGESGVASFGFEVNGSPVDPSQVTLQDGVYSFNFRPTSAGQYTITARGTNGSGIGSSSSIALVGAPL